jgi:predicted phage gp36 major capsid-like protein
MTTDIADIRKTIEEMQKQLREQGEQIERLQKQEHYSHQYQRDRNNRGWGENP